MIKTVATNTKDFFIKSYNEILISEERIDLLMEIALTICNELQLHKTVNLNFICIHNSRRSQLAQIWANYATTFFNLNNIHCFSGGTIVTSFYRNTVKTLQEVGFNFKILKFSHNNPYYSISYNECPQPIIAFSKLYNSDCINTPFIALTTCASANTKCPHISDAIEQFYLPFTDPKNSDNSKLQAEKYLEVNKQIAGEMHYIFRLVKGNL